MLRVVANKNDPNYGKGVAYIAEDDASLLDESEIASKIEALLKAPDYEPPRPPEVATQLLRLSQQSDVEIDQIVDLLKRDAMMTARVLQVAQSPHYQRSSPIQSMREAVTRLGLGFIRDMVLNISLQLRVFRAEAYEETMDRLRLHSLATAYAAQIVCRYSTLPADYAFICGLMHDVGIAASLIALAESSPRKSPPSMISVWPAVERLHSDAGVTLAKTWELPTEIQWVLKAHHTTKLDGQLHPMSAAVCLANQLAIELGFGLAGDADGDDDSIEAACQASLHQIDQTAETVVAQAVEGLGLSGDQLDCIRADLEKVRGEIV